MITVNARVSRRTPRAYVLSAAGQPIGVLRPGALLFDGFRSLDAAGEAAATAAATLVAWCGERHRQLPDAPDLAASPDQLVVRAGDRAVGRVLRPGDDPDVESHGFELRLPEQLWVASGLGLAQRIHLALVEEPVAS